MANPGTTTADPAPKINKTLDGWFEITKRGSTLGRELRGGLVTFFTMAYIIVLNPLIIGTAADVNGNLITGRADRRRRRGVDLDRRWWLPQRP